MAGSGLQEANLALPEILRPHKRLPQSSEASSVLSEARSGLFGARSGLLEASSDLLEASSNL